VTDEVEDEDVDDDATLLDTGGDVTAEDCKAAVDVAATEDVLLEDELGMGSGELYCGVVLGLPLVSIELLARGGLDAAVLDPATTLEPRTLEDMPRVLEGFD
jgi:hypothetical protein